MIMPAGWNADTAIELRKYQWVSKEHFFTQRGT
jgi:hypothetical protein